MPKNKPKTFLLMTAFVFCTSSASAFAGTADVLGAIRSGITLSQSAVNTANQAAPLAAQVATAVTPQKTPAPAALPATSTVEKSPPAPIASTDPQPSDTDFVEMNLLTGKPVQDKWALTWLKAHPVPKEGCAQYLTPEAIKEGQAISTDMNHMAASKAWKKTPAGICFQRATNYYYTGVTKTPDKRE